MIKLTRFAVVLSIITLLLFSLPPAGFGGITLTTITPKGYNPKWTPVDSTLTSSLGVLPLTIGKTLSYNIPATVPSTATEILVYVVAASTSNQAGAYGYATWQISTQETGGTTKYTHPFISWASQYGSYNLTYEGSSTSFWLPVTGDLHIYATLLSSQISNNSLYIFQNTGVYVV